MRPLRAGAIAATALGALLAAPAAPSAQTDAYTPEQLAAVYALSPVGAPAPDATNRVADDPRAARLGQYLFFFTGFSANGAISCASCHSPARAFTDGLPVARGLGLGTRNAPTLLNVASQHWFFWDGRADSLWSQPLQVIENAREMDSDRLRAAHAVYTIPALRRAYERVFGLMPLLADASRFPAHARPDSDPQAPAARAWRAMAEPDRIAVDRVVSNLGKAIEAYERRLVSGSAPFDRYVTGLRKHDVAAMAALSPAAKRGLKLFIGAAHCNLCHNGPAFSDGEFHNIGLPLLQGEASDEGRAAGIRSLAANPFNGGGAFSDAPGGPAAQRLAFLPRPEAELGKFRTPTLRNVALTAPYMHDGRFADLHQVLQFYADGKTASRGRLVGEREATLNVIPHLSQAQIVELIAFLKSLTGAPLPTALAQQPENP
jgi:cytochrome c peroxidase